MKSDLHDRTTPSGCLLPRRKPASRHLRRACNLLLAVAVAGAVLWAVASYYRAGHPTRNLTLPWAPAEVE
jgi:hypothetical protein